MTRQEIRHEIDAVRKRIRELQRETIKELQREITAITCSTVASRELAGALEDISELLDSQ